MSQSKDMRRETWSHSSSDIRLHGQGIDVPSPLAFYPSPLVAGRRVGPEVMRTELALSLISQKLNLAWKAQ